MNKWPLVKLSEVAHIKGRVGWKGYKTSDLRDSGPIVFSGTEIKSQYHINLSNIKHLTQEKFEESPEIILKHNDVLVSTRGTLGEIAIYREQYGPATINPSLVILSEFKGSAEFLYYFLVSKIGQELLMEISSGSTVPAIYQADLKKIEIPLPPLLEQQAISEVLSSLDDKIDLLHRNNKTLEEMAETLFRQWFVEGAKEDWEDGCINDLLNIKSGYAFKSSSFTETGLYKLITIKNVQDGFLDLSKVDYLSSVPHKTPDYCILKEGDILLSLTGNVGRCCLVDSKNLLLNQRVAKLVAKNPLDTGFVYTYFRLNTTRKYLEEISKGTAQANLSPIETGKINIQLPPRELLNSYSLVVTPLLNKLLFNREQINRLEMTRNTLLPKLMSGQVRVIS